MSLIIDSLRRYWLPDIVNTETALTFTLSDWVGRGGFYVKDLSSSTDFSLQLTAVQDAATLFAATANRTMAGCFESIASIAEVERAPKSLAWLIIKLYYAAFFGAHGHMRVCGLSCTNLDAADALKIFELAKLQGAGLNVNKINSGQYLLRFDAPSLTLTFSAMQGSGSHEALWSTYKRFLESIVETAPGLIPIRQQRDLVVGKLSSINMILSLKGSNGGNWLSKIRNTVQYRQSYGVWYPYNINKAVPTKLLLKTIPTFKSDPDLFELTPILGNNESEIESFFEGSLFICSIARRTVIDMAARSSVKSSVAGRGSITFLKLSKMD